MTRKSRLTHDLIAAYKLPIEIIEAQKATITELMEYHSVEYIGAIYSTKELESEGIYDPVEKTPLEYLGLVDDCAKFTDIKEHILYIAGSSITAARAIQDHDVIINWQGGRHHAKKSKAAGFCYVNDVVLCIMQLQEDYQRILYIDIDIHHGDGVEEAFSCSKSVTTCSFHICEPGYFPGSGKNSLNEYTINVPLKPGIQGEKFLAVFTRVVEKVMATANPQVIVLQCGVDGLARDPLGGWNLTEVDYCNCVDYILRSNMPTIILGGGGYNPVNVAKCWTSVTAKCVGVDLPRDIPEIDDWPLFAPDYSINVSKSNQKDYNESVDSILCSISN
ncbi:Histone deacetylase 8 [Boothiomyces macroporosus]|uniref:histone deacetylase n=1 Tax=Boothiomyces macroporosus TaxID=261099 RepID=A0AAD5Y645_9FUNG|nr:Histone deacetylase 8 [Boothiomyces macroporosus]